MAEDTYTVERSTHVDASPDRVYEHVVDFHRWRTWSPWQDLDPDMQQTYSGPELGVGATYAWTGNRKAGAGEMRIVEATPPSTIKIDLRFDKPFKARNATWFTITPDGAGSRVTWTLTGRRTLMLRVMGLFTSMDKMVGGDFERGLARLKDAVERST